MNELSPSSVSYCGCGVESRANDHRVRFGPFDADLRSGELHCDGQKIHLQDQPFQVLSVLLHRAGDLVTREELRCEVWPADTFLEFDHALNTAIKKIRIALSDDAVAPRYVQTIPKRGYRWIAPVTFAANKSDPEPPAHPPGSVWRAKAASFVLGLLLASLVSFVLSPVTKTAKNPSNKIAIFPVRNLTGDPSLDRLCDGIALHIIGRLSLADASPKMAAKPQSPAIAANSNPNATEAPPALKSDYALHANLRSESERLRIDAELIRVSDQMRVWNNTFTHDLNNPLQAEADLARDIATQLLHALPLRPPNASSPLAGPLPTTPEPQYNERE